MGYDMSIKGPPSEQESELLAKATLAFNEAVQARKAWTSDDREDPRFKQLQADVEAAYEAMQKFDVGYFRLNIWGMGKYRDAMAELGMVHWGHDPVTQDEWNSLAEGDEDAHLALVSRHGDGPMTIPGFKLGSNDGWLVTPEEIHGALEAWAECEMAREHLPEAKFKAGISTETYETISEDYWGEWIEYLRLAERRGGFQVW